MNLEIKVVNINQQSDRKIIDRVAKQRTRFKHRELGSFGSQNRLSSVIDFLIDLSPGIWRRFPFPHGAVARTPIGKIHPRVVLVVGA